MKLKQWLYGAAALAMLAACSDKDIAPGGGGEEGKFSTTPGEGYLGITLQLPEQPATRAEEDGDHSNDRFDDGIEAEYNVSKAALLLFWGDDDDENNAEFIGAYPINSDERFDNPNGDNITTSFQNVATLNKKIEPATGKQLWGLAIVNYDENVFKIGGKVNGKYESTNPNYGTLTVSAKQFSKPEGTVEGASVDLEDMTLSESVSDVPITIKDVANGVSGMKFSDFRLLVTKNNPDLMKRNADGYNIFMTNAPLCNSKGETVNPNNDGGYSIQTLARLDASKISESKETAKVNPAGCIFVERALAKVTVSSVPTEATIKYQSIAQGEDGTPKPGAKQDVKLTIKSISCLIDNEEDDSFFIRYAVKGGLIGATGDNDIWIMQHPVNLKYRFVGSLGMDDKTPVYDPNNIHTKDHTWYRTYWCKDPHYASDKRFNKQASATSTYKDLLDDKGKLDTSVAFYPRENTFSLAKQNYKNTTRVVFKVQYEWKDENGNNLNVYCKAGDPSVIYKKSDAEKFLVEAFIASNSLHNFILKYVDGAKAVTNGCGTKNDDGTYNITYGVNDFIIDSDTRLTAEGKLLQLTQASFNTNSALYKSLVLPEGSPADLTLETAIANAMNNVMETANEEVQIRSFAGATGGESNVCYYAVNIAHFGDTYCKMPAGYVGVTTAAVYKNDNARYLGRWGMVRNNWYDLSIDAITNMGFADVPDGNVTTSDDNNKEEYYLSARVHVLSWAKRTQSHKF